MVRKLVIQPRKRASQQRSRATVDALVEATARVLVREGYDRASTNRIAEVAGVSVGSLYQYFPGKDALVVAVIDRHNRAIMAVVRAALVEIDSLSLEAGVRRLVAAAVAGHRVDPKLHRVLTEQIPRTGRLRDVEAFNREAFDLFRAYLDRHADALDVPDRDLAAFICGHAIEAVTHAAVLYRPDLRGDDAVEPLVSETTRLIVGYLRP